MLSGSWARYAPLSGLVFVALFVVSFIVAGTDSVASDDSTQEHVKYWTDNDGEQVASALIGAVGLVFFLWFLGVLRSVLRAAEGGAGRLSATAYAGGILLVTFAAVNGAIGFATAESVGDVPAQVTQTLSVLYFNFFLGFPIGQAVLMLATALVILRTGVLPAWLGWLALVIGIASFAGPGAFFAFLVTLVWIVIVSVILFQRSEPAAPAQTVLPTG